MSAANLTRAVGVLCMLVGFLCIEARAEALDLILPTRNDALYYDDGPSFYMYTDRYFQGVRSRPWQGGRYGFVRNEKETAAGVVFTRFHEGVDIKPLYRDARGEPLDTVRVIDDGRVVYTNFEPGRSSYGKYVVVEHWWSGAPFYSLYAHLGSVHVREGQQLRQGDRLGIMGYTGRGIDRRRAHLHFEINMMFNERFQDWYGAHYRSTNRHGLYNGLNLAGMDVAALYLALRENPLLTIADFITQQESFFSIAVPNTGLLDLQARYPWLADGYDPEAEALEIVCTQSGLPIQIRPAARTLDGPVVTMVQPTLAPYDDITYWLAGSGSRVRLSSVGSRYAELLTLGTHPASYAAGSTPAGRGGFPAEQFTTEAPAPRWDDAAAEPEAERTPVRSVRGW